MTEPVHNHEHLEQARALLTSFFKDDQGEVSEVNQAILDAMVQQVQDLEDVGWSMIYDRILESASGDQLDQVGAIVGEGRISANDEVYRRFIAARIRTNISGGDPETMIWVLDTIAQPVGLRLFQIYPAGVHMIYTLAGFPNDQATRDQIAAHMLDTVAAGVSLDLVEAPSVQPFAFLGAEGEGFGVGTFGTAILSEG